MKNIKTITATIALAALALTGCGSTTVEKSTPEELPTTSYTVIGQTTGGLDIAETTLTLTDGTKVTCLAVAGEIRAGLECNFPDPAPSTK